ncbi:MAG: hypothetical protein BM560_20175 [Roseobacter sp. MedPE-SWde]|nr:MAG: hypothetical protein BM560_20175 [Roseobacter sp. MedPE-SWde]
MWIEELFGRKHSMGFDNVFAVSSSGFTKPAIAKAQALGVTLFKLSSFGVETTTIALEKPDIYILCADQANVLCLASSDSISKDDLERRLSKGFHFDLETLYGVVENLKDAGNETLKIDQDAVQTTSLTRKRKVGGIDVVLKYDIQARVFWHKFQLKPHYFRKLKPGEVSTSAEIYDDETTPGISAELIVSENRLDLSLDYLKNGGWNDRYHFCCAQIFYENLPGKQIRVRQNGRTQLQFTFKYLVLEHAPPVKRTGG